MIGVIGGNGVAATNRLLSLIEENFTRNGAFRDAHHPEMLVWQATKAPSRSMYLEGRGESFIEDYVAIAKKMKDCGCDLACMCCNTAHYAVDEIARKSGLPFIHLLKEVATAAKKTGKKRFEIFASDGCVKFHLYDKAFAEVYPQAELVYPSAERQALVTKVICNVKSRARFSDNSDENPASLLNNLIKTALAPVILGCTDLRNALDDKDKICLDSLEVLADAICKGNDKE